MVVYIFNMIRVNAQIVISYLCTYAYPFHGKQSTYKNVLLNFPIAIFPHSFSGDDFLQALLKNSPSNYR